MTRPLGVASRIKVVSKSTILQIVKDKIYFWIMKMMIHLDKISPDQAITFVPLAWNFFDEIRQRIKKVRDNPDDRFVRYFPKAELTK